MARFKSDNSDFSDYALVADRITLFYERFPKGQIITCLHSRTRREITFRARVYRDQSEVRPAATGWASERIGDGEINQVACLENTETSAIGRALANLGFTASKQRPSAEEMAKAARARTRLHYEGALSGVQKLQAVESEASPRRYVSEPSIARGDALQSYADSVSDVIRLLDTAARQGMKPERVELLRARLLRGGMAPSALAKLERALTRWLSARRASRFERSDAPTS